MKLLLREVELDLRPEQPLIMGILNIGTDSVADSNLLTNVEDQVARGLALARDGAQIIDIGVLSGRTDTEPIPVAEEAARLEPVVQALTRAGVTVSVDSWRTEAIQAAVAAGAQFVNDTSGLIDPAVADICAASGAALLVMHTRAAPKQVNFPTYTDAVADVTALLKERVGLALSRGVTPDQIVIDPGLDYAKAPSESIEVLRRLDELAVFERPVLLAVSRKYFIGMIADALPEQRLAGTIAALEFGLRRGAHILRVHDVAHVAQYLRMRAALHGDSQPAMLGDRNDERLKWIAPKA
ncbi:MAG: dihydropteroate synthase [Solirubrobacteraceae bacterium]